MLQEQVKEESFEDVSAPDPAPNARIIIKFFTLWFSSLAILVVIALLSNIEWARGRIETAFCQTFHRQVKLGRLSWSFGLDGLAIDSDRLEMKEQDGKSPFISSGPTEIGIAFLPLFQKRLVIKHLQFEHPEVWAVRLANKRWNFSDLVANGPEIHMVQVKDGLLHLRNVASEATSGSGLSWQSYDFTEVKFSATLPYRDRCWPLFLSCKIPLEGAGGNIRESKLRLSATGKGPFKDWSQNKYSIDLQLQNFDLSRFRPLYAGAAFLANLEDAAPLALASQLPQAQGLCDLHFKGEGIFSQGFTATASGIINDLKMGGFENKELQLAQAGATCSLLINPAVIVWKDLKLSLAEWQLESSGTLSDWQKETRSYEAKVGGKLNDLKGFFNKVISCFLPEQSTAAHKDYADSKLDKIGKAQSSGELAAGSATVELRLQGGKDEHTVATNIKAEGIPLSQLVDDKLGGEFVEALKLNPTAPIRGELSINPGKKLEVKDLEIPLEDSKIKLTGFMDSTSKRCEFNFEAANLSFDSFKKRIDQDNKLLKSLCASSSSKGKPYSLAGRLDLKGKYKFDGKKADVFVDSTLKGLKLAKPDGSAPLCSNIRGKIVYDNGIVQLKQVAGATANGGSGSRGGFIVNGSFSMQDESRTELDLHAHEISFVQLKEWIKRFGLKLPHPGLEGLTGNLHELSAHVCSADKLKTSFSISPADLLLDIPGRADEGTHQFHLSSGTISYARGEFSARDVTLSGHNGKLVASGTARGDLNDLKFVSANVKTDGFDIGDLQSLVKGRLSQDKSSLPEFMRPGKQTPLHGRVNGEINYTAQGNAAGINGVVGFHNVGGKFGRTLVPVEKLTGVVAISSDQLVIEDTTGQIGKSTFAVDGVIHDYATPNLSWQGQLRGQFYPEEVDTIMSNLGHGIALDSISPEALNLRVSGSGEKGSSSLTFRGKASPTYGLSLKTAFGIFHQPQGRPLNFFGGLSTNESDSQITLSNFQLTSGNEHILASGTFKWANEREEKPASLSFSLATPTPVKSATIFEIIAQDRSPEKLANAQIGGTSQLNLKVEGPVNDLVLSGSVALDKNSYPAVHIDNLTGKLEIPGWRFMKSGGADKGTSVAKLQLNTLSTGGLNLHDAAATLSLDAGKMIFKDFQANLSGGKLSISGFYNLDNQNYHADIKVSKLVVDEFVKDLIDHSGGVSGLADLNLSLDNTSDSPRSLSGSGQFSVYQGAFASFGKLQEKLNESNLLQQGIFGFNVNNLLQAMMPVKSGQFNEVSGRLTISHGDIYFDQLRFEGNNLRMRAAGKFDFISRHMDVDVAGDIPRVSSSIIPGAIGEMSRKVTLQRMFSIVTFKKLKDLPALPLLGDIANDDPRAFAFSVDTPTEPARLMTEAAEKSFKWLPNKPFASAHPVPGI